MNIVLFKQYMNIFLLSVISPEYWTTGQSSMDYFITPPAVGEAES